MSNIYQSKHKGQVIDQTVNDTVSLKERMRQAETDIQYLNTHKANSNTVPKSIKDLEPNASLVHIGSDTPPSSCDIWFFSEANDKYIIRVLSAMGEWVDVASGTGGSNIDEDAIITIVNREIEALKDSGELDGKDGVSVTHQWDGTILTVTSASGSSSANLKGEDGHSPILAAMTGTPDPDGYYRMQNLAITSEYHYQDGVLTIEDYNGTNRNHAWIPVGLEVPKVLGKPINVRLKIDEQPCEKAQYKFRINVYDIKTFESVQAGDTLSFTLGPYDEVFALNTYSDELDTWEEFSDKATTGELVFGMDIVLEEECNNSTVKISDFVITVEGESPRWFIWDDKQMAYVDSGVNAQGEQGKPGEKGDKGDTPTPDVSIKNPETLAVNTIYDLGVQNALVINLPSGKISDFIQVDFLSGETPTTLTITSASGLSEYDFVPEANMVYSLYFDWGVLYYNAETSTYVYGWRFTYAEYVASEV